MAHLHQRVVCLIEMLATLSIEHHLTGWCHVRLMGISGEMQLGLSSLEISSCNHIVVIYINIYIYMCVCVCVCVCVSTYYLMLVMHVDQSNYRSGYCYRLSLARATALGCSSYTCENRLRTYLAGIASYPGHVML